MITLNKNSKKAQGFLNDREWAMCKYNNSIYSICFNPLIQVYVFNYKDCEEDIKEDRETGPYVYPSDYTAFDLFIDNIILYAKESDFKDNDFIKLFKELNEVEFTDYKEFAYWAVLNKIINNCYRYGTKLFLPIIIKYKHFMEVI